MSPRMTRRQLAEYQDRNPSAALTIQEQIDQTNILNEQGWTELKLRNKQGDIVAMTKVGVVDLPLANGHTWSLDHFGYARARSKGKTIFLHRLLLGAASGQVVDHINHDPLDNRRENLRLASKSENAANRKSHAATHGFIGVVLDKGTGRYRGVVTLNYKSHHTKRFVSPRDAGGARDVLAIALQGDFARLNFPVEEHFPW